MAGTAPPQSFITAGRTTETMPGTAATMARAPLLMVLTAPRTPAPAITRPPGRTHVAAQSRTATEAQSAGQAYNPKTGAYAATEQGSNANGSWGSSRFRKTAIPHTASIKRRLKEPRARYKPRTAARLLERRVSTTALPWVRPQTATSMRQRTVTPTKTRAAAGSNTRWKFQFRSSPKAMEGRKRAADHRPSAEAAAEAGNPGRRVLVVRRAGAGVRGRR